MKRDEVIHRAPMKNGPNISLQVNTQGGTKIFDSSPFLHRGATVTPLFPSPFSTVFMWGPQIQQKKS